jgi:hypothetical protein
MRTFITLTAAAPLALLAACGETTSADESRPEPMEIEVAALEQAEPQADPLPSVPENALAEVDFGGTYARESADGTERLTLNPEDDSYEYTAPNGTVSRGSYTRLEDNRRLAIEDFAGEPAYFSIAEGSIFRLDAEDTPPNQITVTGQYQRDNTTAAQTTGPGATTDNVGDRRN